MNKYIRALFCVPCGVMKMAWIKLFHFKSFRGPLFACVSPCSEITLEYGGRLTVGKGFKMRDGAKLRVRKGAVCAIGQDVSLNSFDVITCRENIEICDRVQFSPNVQIYDHDHDGTARGKYKTSPVKIGNDVWIGANTVILRGSAIGDNCVIGAGSVVKGNIPQNSVLIQKRENSIL